METTILINLKIEIKTTGEQSTRDADARKLPNLSLFIHHCNSLANSLSISTHRKFKADENSIRLLNVGVGPYIEKPFGITYRLVRRFEKMQFIERVFSASTITNVLTSQLLFPSLHKLRISETFAEPEYGTNMVEQNPKKLAKMSQLGRQSFAKYEKEIEKLLS